MTLILYALLGFTIAQIALLAIEYSVKRAVYGNTISDFQLSQLFGNLYDWHDLEITVQGGDVIIHNLRLTEPDRKFFFISNMSTPPAILPKSLVQRLTGKYYIQISSDNIARIPYNSPFTAIIDKQVEDERAFIEDYTS